MSQTTIIESTLFTLGGRVRCVRCSALSKRTKQQCMAPAVKGKSKCRAHGGKSTGPTTPEGRQRCADAKTAHGQETRQLRTERALARAKLAVLEIIGHDLDLLDGPRSPGPKPHKIGEVLPELQNALRFVLFKSDTEKEK